MVVEHDRCEYDGGDCYYLCVLLVVLVVGDVDGCYCEEWDCGVVVEYGE